MGPAVAEKLSSTYGSGALFDEMQTAEFALKGLINRLNSPAARLPKFGFGYRFAPHIGRLLSRPLEIEPIETSAGDIPTCVLFRCRRGKAADYSVARYKREVIAIVTAAIPIKTKIGNATSRNPPPYVATA
jgi:hypothetical protein